MLQQRAPTLRRVNPKNLTSFHEHEMMSQGRSHAKPTPHCFVPNFPRSRPSSTGALPTLVTLAAVFSLREISGRLASAWLSPVSAIDTSSVEWILLPAILGQNLTSQGRYGANR
jgi:hypothetical protein